MWLPGYERWELPGVPGVPYDEPDDPKAMWHSTEGWSIPDAVAAYRAYPPHLCVDYKTRRKVQHISLSRGAYALWNEDADDSRCIQIEVVGFSKDAHDWPDEMLKWLGEEVARPLHDHFGVPYIAAPQGFKAPHQVNFILASPSSPLRFTQRQFDSFTGHCAHQHCPGDSHWDVPLNIERILHHARGNILTTKGTEMRLIKGNQRDEIWVVTFTGDGIQKRHVRSAEELDLLKSLSGEEVHTVDQWKIDVVSEESIIGGAVWNYRIPETDSDNPETYRPAHRVIAAVNEHTSGS